MPDWWSHRLVVQGPLPDVRAFRRAATANRTSRSEGSRLSFRRLMSIIPTGAAVDARLGWFEPLDLFVDPITKLEDGMAEVVHGFEFRGAEIEPLLVETSRLYPRLCFVLGTISPATDDQESRFINHGRMQVWTLSASQKERLVAPVLEIMNDASRDDVDEEFWVLQQFS